MIFLADDNVPFFDNEGYLLNPSFPKKEDGSYDVKPVMNVFEQVEFCKSFAKLYPNGGTILLSLLKVVKMRTGYQFSFKRPITEYDWTKEEYDEISNWIMKKTGSRLFAGFWNDGNNALPDTEPSFWTDSVAVAKYMAKLFNQEVILNWKSLNSDDPNKYLKNVFYNEGNPKYSKKEILEMIRKENSK